MIQYDDVEPKRPQRLQINEFNQLSKLETLELRLLAINTYRRLVEAGWSHSYSKQLTARELGLSHAVREVMYGWLKK